MYVSVPTTQPSQPVIDALSQALLRQLSSGQKVLWLVSGGSAIGVACGVASALQGHSLDTLTVSLVDERFGPVGHPDSNWQQLLDAGFSLPGARLVPVLNGDPLEATVAAFSDFLAAQLKQGAYIIGLFGIGADGHTSGILPHSTATASQELVHAYTGGGYTRITTTFPCIEKLDEAIVYAVGEAKHATLTQLKETVDPVVQPAQILKSVKKLTIFNDLEGEK